MNGGFGPNVCEWSVVTLILSGDRLDPYKITEMLCVRPDREFKRREVVTKSGCTSKIGTWELKCEEEGLTVEEQLETILKRISPAKERLAQIVEEDESIETAYIQITVGLPSDCYAAGYCFKSGLVNEFTAIGFDFTSSTWLPDWGSGRTHDENDDQSDGDWWKNGGCS